MSDEIKVTQWSRLPPWVKTKVEELGIANAEEWIQQRIPALGQKSVIELAFSKDGETLLRDYFTKVIGR